MRIGVLLVTALLAVMQLAADCGNRSSGPSKEATESAQDQSMDDEGMFESDETPEEGTQGSEDY